MGGPSTMHSASSFSSSARNAAGHTREADANAGQDPVRLPSFQSSLASVDDSAAPLSFAALICCACDLAA